MRLSEQFAGRQIAALCFLILMLCGVSPSIAAGTCGGFAGRECGSGEICVYMRGQCPQVARDGMGVCMRADSSCTGAAVEVCGCDGVTYTSLCAALKSRAPVSHVGACTGSGNGTQRPTRMPQMLPLGTGSDVN